MSTGKGYSVSNLRVYFNEREVADADVSSLEIVDDLVARDSLGLIMCGWRVKDVDASMFEWVAASEQDRSRPDGRSNYFRTRDGVYFWDSINHVSRLRTKNDPALFRCIDEHYASDGDFVFFERTRLPDARLADWHRVGHCYFASSGYVYSWGRRLRSVSAATFEVLPGPHDYARDRNAYFVEWRKVGPKPFVSWLSRTSVVEGRVVQSVATRGVKWMKLCPDIAEVDEGEGGWMRLLIILQVESVVLRGDDGEALAVGQQIPILVSTWRGTSYPYRGPVSRYQGTRRTLFLAQSMDQPRHIGALGSTLFANEACLDTFNYADRPNELQSLLRLLW